MCIFPVDREENCEVKPILGASRFFLIKMQKLLYIPKEVPINSRIEQQYCYFLCPFLRDTLP